MYQNNQLDLLINAYEGSIPPNVAQVIATIQAIYKAYNDDYSRYTENYISMMESTFNSLKTAQLIPEAKGGTLRTTKPIDSENILALLSDYHDKLFGLRYLKFLSEEKKTVVFVGPNGCGKTTFLYRYSIRLANWLLCWTSISTIFNERHSLCFGCRSKSNS